MAKGAPTPGSFKPGQSGNPNGRPKKGYSITEWFQEMFNSKPEVKDAIGKSIIKKALEGDITAQKLVWNYMDGLPMSHQDNQAVQNTQINLLVGNNDLTDRLVDFIEGIVERPDSPKGGLPDGSTKD